MSREMTVTVMKKLGPKIVTTIKQNTSISYVSICLIWLSQGFLGYNST